MTSGPPTGELRANGDDFEIWEDGRRVGEARHQGDRYDVYKWGRKIAELHPRGNHFDVHSGPFWGKTGEIRRHGHDYHVYEGGSRTQEITPGRGFHANFYDVRDVSPRSGDLGDDLILGAATAAGAGIGWILGGLVEAVFKAATAKKLRQAPVDRDEPIL